MTRSAHRLPTTLAALLSAALFGRADAGPGDRSAYPAPLRPETFQGVTLDGSTLRLMDDAIVQADPRMLVVEAEDAVEFRFQQYIGVLRSGRAGGGGDIVQEYARDLYEYEPQEDGEASAGRYIDYVDSARYLITITEPGEYAVWARHWMPHAGFWCYNHQLDGTRTERIDMPIEEDQVRQWHWVRAHPVRLGAGTHTFTIADLHNGKRLDKLVFHRDPDWVPEGAGPEAAPRRALDRGEVEFSTLAPAGLEAWHGLNRSVSLYGGSIEFDWSADGGATWNGLPPDRRLPEAARAEPALRFRARFARAPGRPSPALRAPSALFSVRDGAFAELSSDSYRILVDRGTGAVAGLWNLESGASIVDPALPPQNPLSVFVKQPGEPGRWLPFSEARLTAFEADESRVRSRYAFLDGAVEATCEIEALPGRESRWTVTVENRSDLDVLRVRYPQFERVALDGDSGDDILLWPHLGGMFYPVPALGPTLKGGYPAHLGLGFISLFDETGGFCVALDDEDLVSSHLTLEPARCKQAVGLHWEMRHRIRAGGGRRAYRFRVGVHPGDWHEAADLYRESFFRRFPRPDYPDWLVESDGWVYGAVGLDTGYGLRSYDEIRSHVTMGALEFGHDYAQVWGSTFSGACPTYYLPRLECGGPERFARRNREFREAGGRIGYYFHGNAIGGAYTLKDTYYKTPWEAYPEEVRAPDWDWYVRNRNYPDEETRIEPGEYRERIGRWLRGEVRGRNSGLHTYYHMSYHTGEFFRWLTEWTDRYILEYGANAIYYDTMAWGADREEFNPFGDYHGEGDRAGYKIEFLRGNIERLRPLDPEFVQWTEGCTDVWNIFCGALISGFTRHGVQEVVRYTFPEMIFADGHANGRWEEDSHKESLAGAWLMGNKFDVIVRSDWSERLFALRQLASPLLARSRFLGRIGLEPADGPVRARGHRVDFQGTRAALVTIWNPEERADAVLTLDLARYGRPERFYLLEPGRDPRPVEVERADGRIRFPAPAAMCSALIGVESVSPDRALAVSLRFDGESAVARLMNYSDGPLPVRLRVEAGAVEFEESERRLEVPPGHHRVVFRARNAAERNAREILALDVEAGGATRRFLTWAGPILDNGLFDAYEHPAVTPEAAYRGRHSRWVGLSDRPLERAYSFPGAGPLVEAGVYEAPFVSWPRHRYRVRLATRGALRPPSLQFGWTSDRPGRIPLVPSGEDRGWTLWEAEFDGRGHGRLVVEAEPGQGGFVDAVRAEILGPAPGGH